MASTDLQPSASMFLTSIWSGFEDASSTALVLTGSAMHRVDDPEAEPEAEVVLRLDVDAEFSEHFPVFLSLTARMKKGETSVCFLSLSGFFFWVRLIFCAGFVVVTPALSQPSVVSGGARRPMTCSTRPLPPRATSGVVCAGIRKTSESTCRKTSCSWARRPTSRPTKSRP